MIEQSKSFHSQDLQQSHLNEIYQLNSMNEIAKTNMAKNK